MINYRLCAVKKVCLWQNMSWTFLNFFSHSYFSLALFSTTSISYQTWFSIFVCVFCSFLFNYFHLFIIPLTYFICVVCVFFLFLSQQVFQALIEWYSSIKAILNIFIIFKLKVDGPSHPKNAIYVLSFIYTYLVHNWEKNTERFFEMTKDISLRRWRWRGKIRYWHSHLKITLPRE